jgi:hypothetical protein
VYPFREDADDERCCNIRFAVRSPDAERPLLIGMPPPFEGGWYDVGRGLAPWGIAGRAVGGLATPLVDEECEDGRFSA